MAHVAITAQELAYLVIGTMKATPFYHHGDNELVSRITAVVVIGQASLRAYNATYPNNEPLPMIRAADVEKHLTVIAWSSENPRSEAVHTLRKLYRNLMDSTGERYDDLRVCRYLNKFAMDLLTPEF